MFVVRGVVCLGVIDGFAICPDAFVDESAYAKAFSASAVSSGNTHSMGFVVSPFAFVLHPGGNGVGG